MLFGDLLANRHLEFDTRASDLLGWNLNTSGFWRTENLALEKRREVFESDFKVAETYQKTAAWKLVGEQFLSRFL